MLHRRPGVIVAVSRQGYPPRPRWIETRPLEPEPVHTGGGSAAPWLTACARLPGRSQRAMSKTTIPTPVPTVSDAAAGDYGDNFPGSTKAYVGAADGVRVPVRRIALSAGEPPLDVYDTSGPLGHDVRDGLPELRREWIRGRAVVEGERRTPARTGHRHERGAEGAHPPGAARHRAGDPAALRAQGRDHARDGVHRHARGPDRRVRPRRGGARPRHHPGQHQPPRARADDHRPQLPREDQRQHRQLRRAARRSRRRSRSCAGRRCGAPTR